jgi:hypothetical protein
LNLELIDIVDIWEKYFWKYFELTI